MVEISRVLSSIKQRRIYTTQPDSLNRDSRFSFLGLTISSMLDGLPFQAHTGNDSSCGTGNGDVESVSQTLHVRIENGIESIHTAHALKNFLDFRGSAVDEDVGVNTKVVALNLVDETVLEKGLSNSNKDGATEGLEELNASSTDRNPFLGQYGLNDEDTNLETSTNTETSDDLITKPLLER